MTKFLPVTLGVGTGALVSIIICDNERPGEAVGEGTVGVPGFESNVGVSVLDGS